MPIADSQKRNNLIKKAQNGDVVAINALIADCQIDVKRYAGWHCRVSDIEDVAQETLWILSRRVSYLKSIDAFSSWLFTIVKRECHRALRAAYRNIMPRVLLIPSAIAEQEIGLKYDLAKCLESLPPHYLEIILLRDFEELTVLEIAHRLNEDIPAVKSRIHRARQMIRDYFLADKIKEPKNEK